MNIYEYVCESCGASGEPKASQCCDECIVKFFTLDVNAPILSEVN